MSVTDLPDSHVRLIFAVQLHRAGLLDDAGLRAEAQVAFGEVAGTQIGDRLLAMVRPATVTPA